MDRVFVITLTIALLSVLGSSVDIIGPEDALIEDKSTANLTCVGADTNMTVEWTKDDQVLSPSNRTQILADNMTVVISPVRRTDAGVYRCTVNNHVSSDTANYTMTVNFGPEVKILGATHVEEGSDILLLCSTVSLPAASLTWTVEGVSAGHSPVIIIENSNLTHSGTYSCTAFNSVTGLTVSAEQLITVTGKELSSGLSAGAAAGITAGVLLGVAVLATGLAFLIIHLKNLDGPVCKIPISISRRRSITVREEEEEDTEQKSTRFGATTQSRQVSARSEGFENPYMNTEPAVPPKKPAPLPKKNISTGPPPLPERDINMKPPKRQKSPDTNINMGQPRLPDRDYNMRRPRIPDRDEDMDDFYSTTLP